MTEEIQRNYPNGGIPFHSRYGHLRAGGVDRIAKLEVRLTQKGLDHLACARSKIDLVVASVLVDAGAGMQWRYQENATSYSRSEGLAVASFHLFDQGLFSSDTQAPWQVDAQALQNLSTRAMTLGFQVSDSNPMVGLEGRTELLKKLASCLKSHPEIFKNPRPGALLDTLLERSKGGTVRAGEILGLVLRGLAEMWPVRARVGGIPFGDVWHHPLLGERGRFESLMPFHKLSQWLTYSLIEPIEEAGLKVTGLDEMTGLPEYRNGGLLLDLGLLELADPADAQKAHDPSSLLVIEWRALTVAFLDQIADRIRAKLKVSATEMPLAKILQGGTWSAGRRIASTKRADGGSPLQVVSDGTVF